jgi:hypothetical protein
VAGPGARQSGQAGEAKVVLDAFLATKPDHWGALGSRARISDKLGENGGGAECSREGFRKLPLVDRAAWLHFLISL